MHHDASSSTLVLSHVLERFVGHADRSHLWMKQPTFRNFSQRDFTGRNAACSSPRFSPTSSSHFCHVLTCVSHVEIETWTTPCDVWTLTRLISMHFSHSCSLMMPAFPTVMSIRPRVSFARLKKSATDRLCM